MSDRRSFEDIRSKLRHEISDSERIQIYYMLATVPIRTTHGLIWGLFLVFNNDFGLEPLSTSKDLLGSLFQLLINITDYHGEGHVT